MTDTDFDDYLPFAGRDPRNDDERHVRLQMLSRWFTQKEDYVAYGLAHQTIKGERIVTHYFPLCHDSQYQP